MTERIKVHAWKACKQQPLFRGFESHPHRQTHKGLNSNPQAAFGRFDLGITIFFITPPPPQPTKPPQTKQTKEKTQKT